jgi:cystathionine beta-lyase
LKKFGVDIEYYSAEESKDIEALIKDNTKVIFMESPGSLTFEIQDIEAITKIAREKNIFTIIDNSWATPLYLKPLDFGVDISIHAVTKYINGCSDLLMGAIITNKATKTLIQNTYKALGLSVSPQECYLALRGIRSMKARLEYQERSLKKVFDALEKFPQVKKILAPSHKDFESHELWIKYFTGHTSLFSVELDKQYNLEKIAAMIDGYKFFGIGASWGGFESLVRYFRIDSGVRAKDVSKFSGSLVRFYIGLEDVDDLIEDLSSGFERLK